MSFVSMKKKIMTKVSNHTLLSTCDRRGPRFSAKLAVWQPAENGVHIVCAMQSRRRSVHGCNGARDNQVQESSVCNPYLLAHPKPDFLGLELSWVLQVVRAVQPASLVTDYAECYFDGRVPSHLQLGTLDICISLLVCFQASAIGGPRWRSHRA